MCLRAVKAPLGLWVPVQQTETAGAGARQACTATVRHAVKCGALSRRRFAFIHQGGRRCVQERRAVTVGLAGKALLGVTPRCTTRALNEVPAPFFQWGSRQGSGFWVLGPTFPDSFRFKPSIYNWPCNQLPPRLVHRIQHSTSSAAPAHLTLQKQHRAGGTGGWATKRASEAWFFLPAWFDSTAVEAAVACAAVILLWPGGPLGCSMATLVYLELFGCTAVWYTPP